MKSSYNPILDDPCQGYVSSCLSYVIDDCDCASCEFYKTKKEEKNGTQNKITCKRNAS